MSLFDIKSIISLPGPVPYKVWAIICAILLMAAVLRAAHKLVQLPEPLAKHAHMFWLVAFAFPLLLISAIFLWPDLDQRAVGRGLAAGENGSGAAKSTSAKDASKSAESGAPSKLSQYAAECAASRDERDGIHLTTSAGGIRKIIARRSVVQPDSTQRFAALKIAEMQAKADFVRHAREYMSAEGQVTQVNGHHEFRETLKNIASSNLSGVQTRQSCWHDGLAWVTLEIVQ